MEDWKKQLRDNFKEPSDVEPLELWIKDYHQLEDFISAVEKDAYKRGVDDGYAAKIPVED